MRRRDQRGSSTVWGTAGAVVLILVGQVAAFVTGVVARQHQVDAAADLSALSAAADGQRGEPVCATSAAIAAANKVSLVSCRETGGDVVVVVEDVVQLPFGIDVELHGMARAGP